MYQAWLGISEAAAWTTESPEFQVARAELSYSIFVQACDDLQLKVVDRQLKIAKSGKMGTSELLIMNRSLYTNLYCTFQ